MGAESKKGDKEEAENKSGPEEDVAQEVVLKVDMHCEACAKKVARSLRGFKGVEQVSVDCKANKVVVKAAKEVDPLQLQDRLHKKSGRKVDLLSPLPTPTIKPGSDDSNPVVVEDPPKKDEAPPPPPPVTTTVVLQVGMHCEACAQALRRRIRKIKGVESVETDVGDDRVTVKGVIEDPDKLAELIHKRTRKHASVVKPKPAEPKGEDQKPPEDPEKKHKDEESTQGEAHDDDNNQDQDEDDLLAKSEHCPTRAYMEYYYSNAPQLFSDENPNACTVM